MDGSPSNSMLDPAIFAYLQSETEKEARFREEVQAHVQGTSAITFEIQGRLSSIHATPRSQYHTLVQKSTSVLFETLQTRVRSLASIASQQPYYKYNDIWSRCMQAVIYTALLRAWLGCEFSEVDSPKLGRLLNIEEVGKVFSVPTNAKDRDCFHLTIEEYLLALTDLTQELSRLATNSVTMGDIELSVLIGTFTKDIFAGFQVLNLKNDILRKRIDRVKYDVKKVEEIMYDLSLRNMLPKEEA